MSSLHKAYQKKKTLVFELEASVVKISSNVSVTEQCVLCENTL